MLQNALVLINSSHVLTIGLLIGILSYILGTEKTSILYIRLVLFLYSFVFCNCKCKSSFKASFNAPIFLYSFTYIFFLFNSVYCTSSVWYECTKTHNFGSSNQVFAKLVLKNWFNCNRLIVIINYFRFGQWMIICAKFLIWFII